MISAHELRIGNTLKKDKQIIITVDGRTILDCQWNKEYCARYDPIPLTDDLLMKFGFEPSEHFEHWKSLKLPAMNEFQEHEQTQTTINIFRGLFEIRTKYITKTWREESVRGFQEINYVHQLQNLYFTLTGSELTVKEPQKV